MIKPRWSPEISAGQVLQSALLFVQAVALLSGGLWFTFGVVSGINHRIDAGEAKAQVQDVNTASRIEILTQQTRSQADENAQWRSDVKEQLAQITRRLEDGNKALVGIQLGLANKVDRKP